MQISDKSIENLLVNMVLTFNKTQIWKDSLPFLFTWE